MKHYFDKVKKICFILGVLLGVDERQDPKVSDLGIKTECIIIWKKKRKRETFTNKYCSIIGF